MFPVLGAIAAVGSALYQNRASAKQAAMNRDFQADMSGTAYQRAATDARLAGLNRILAMTQGPASTPGGSMASQVGAPEAISSALSIGRVKAETDLLREQARGVAADSDVKEFMRDYEEQRYSEAEAIKDKDGNIVVTPVMRKIIREELQARMAQAKAGQLQPGQVVELTKADTAFRKLQAGGQKLSNEEKELLLEILRKEQPGHLDAAGLWSSAAGGARRRSDYASEGMRKWLPWGGHGSSARSNTVRQ